MVMRSASGRYAHVPGEPRGVVVRHVWQLNLCLFGYLERIMVIDAEIVRRALAPAPRANPKHLRPARSNVPNQVRPSFSDRAPRSIGDLSPSVPQ